MHIVDIQQIKVDLTFNAQISMHNYTQYSQKSSRYASNWLIIWSMNQEIP